MNIVTLADGQIYKAGATDFAQMVYSMAVMSRANEESLTKSHRLAAAWDSKRAAIDSLKLTKICPAWLRLTKDRTSFEVDESRAALVRRIFSLALDGIGVHSITRILNGEHAPTFGRTAGWNESYVQKILKNRATIGEFQPFATAGGLGRRPMGDPIKDYYPAVVDSSLFLRVQAEMRGRATKKGGRKGEEVKNLFTHLAVCSYCGLPMRMVDKGKGPKGGRYLKCSSSVRGMGCSPKGWRYKDFESSFLYLATEVDLAALLADAAVQTKSEQDETRIIAIGEQIEGLERQRNRLTELLAEPDVGTEFIRAKLGECHSSIKRLTAELDALKAETNNSRLGVMPDKAEALEIIESLRNLSGTSAYEKRSKLSQKLRGLIEKIEVAVEGELPKFRSTVEFLSQQEPDGEFRARLVDFMEEMNQAESRYNPTFLVRFKGGSVRKVVVSNESPTAYVTVAEVETDGASSLEESIHVTRGSKALLQPLARLNNLDN